MNKDSIFVKQAPEFVAVFGPDGFPLTSKRMQQELDGQLKLVYNKMIIRLLFNLFSLCHLYTTYMIYRQLLIIHLHM